MTATSFYQRLTVRRDVLTLLSGILFSLAFTALIAWAGGRLDAIELLPDQGDGWYYWKLPEPTFWTHFSAWGLYLAHQLTFWGLIYYAQKYVRRYSTGLKPVNLVALSATALFIVLHFIQTHIWYDGLAQDVSVFSSQNSVIVLLVWVLLMENNRRGLFFGKKLPVGKEIVRWARTYHGYFFSWATIYTFWFHPLVSTPGHLIGFLYIVLAAATGKPDVHTSSHESLVDADDGGHCAGARKHGCLRPGRRFMAYVLLRVRWSLRYHPDARCGSEALDEARGLGSIFRSSGGSLQPTRLESYH